MDGKRSPKLSFITTSTYRSDPEFHQYDTQYDFLLTYLHHLSTKHLYHSLYQHFAESPVKKLSALFGEQQIRYPAWCLYVFNSSTSSVTMSRHRDIVSYVSSYIRLVSHTCDIPEHNICSRTSHSAARTFDQWARSCSRFLLVSSRCF